MFYGFGSDLNCFRYSDPCWHIMSYKQWLIFFDIILSPSTQQFVPLRKKIGATSIYLWLIRGFMTEKRMYISEWTCTGLWGDYLMSKCRMIFGVMIITWGKSQRGLSSVPEWYLCYVCIDCRRINIVQASIVCGSYENI